MASGVLFSGLFFIVLSSLSSTSNGGINAQNSELSQPQGSVSVVIGEVLHLECQVARNLPPGPVKWYLGEGPQRKLIYVDIQTDEEDKRVTRNSPGSNTDFTISISNVTLEDAGTYYCVKERRLLGRSYDWFQGPGTLVVVEGFERPPFYGLYLGLFLNKLAAALLLFGFFQRKQHRCCLARYLAKCRRV
ncbi:tyrosine-protein phosphatase non-receptor type substrate 1-like [Thamnophis elegans]|uniref:tyrosine-protein phosphatase non-receptor type substrate 1-like n=1 Tax=Thamnophis elegans TaxID=35005 RepID=UPI00137685BD|nr:tyrosine-protein phosphatase non-receptor type substrate 1-like [Thamnophis elegans]